MAKYKTPKIEEMLDAGVHFGHQTKRWHPKMEPYIYTVKKNIHIIDLETTDDLLKKASEFLFETAKEGKQIIFVGTKKQARDVIVNEAKISGSLYVIERWIGGTITNFKIIKKNIDKLLDLKRRREEGDLEKYTKKERLLIDREIEKLENRFGGIVGLNGVPGALFIVDVKREKTAMREAKIAGVPVVALIDTNSNPEDIDYVIPGNDDAIKSIAIVLKTLSGAVEAGYKEYDKKIKDKEDGVKAAEAPVVPAASETPVKVTGDESPVVSEAAPDIIEEVLPEEIVVKLEDKTETKEDKAKKKGTKVSKETEEE